MKASLRQVSRGSAAWPAMRSRATAGSSHLFQSSSMSGAEEGLLMNPGRGRHYGDVDDDEYEEDDCKCDWGGQCCSRYVQQPQNQLGIWVLEAGPADGDWRSLDSVMILSASANASSYMLGQDVDLTGFALHPNPTDSFYAGSVLDWSTKVDVPEAVTASLDKAAVGVRCRPFGGEDDNGQLMWIAGLVVARTAESMCFVCVDLVAHGPVRDDTVSRLADLGLFDKYHAEEPPPPRKRAAPPSSALCAAKLNEYDEVRHLAHDPRPAAEDCWKTNHWNHLSRQQAANMQSLRERTEAVVTNPHHPYCSPPLPPARAKPDHAAGYDLDFSGDSEDFSMDDRSMDEHSMDDVDELGQCVRDLDLNHEQQWATLVQGSRVL
mmetsp:Transcript_17052/g.53248  ORF Transcript_17052/g.53248 Transcript_17052/m.53248 type:complete len:378 (-) Transcript_17052:184-1317(-)